MKPRSDLAIEIVDGEMIVLDKTVGKVHQLNSSASFVWSCLADGQVPDKISEMLSEAFNISPEAALSDVLDTVEELRRLDLVVD